MRRPKLFLAALTIAASLLGQDAISPGNRRKSKPPAVRVDPATVVLDGGNASQQLVVLADGRDITSTARFKSAKPRVAAVGKTGLIAAVSDGATVIEISARGFRSIPKVPVTVRNAKLVAASYANDIQPLLSRAGCNSGGCHGARSGRGGLKLSLFGGDPDGDYDAITRSGAGRRIDKVAPPNSLMLLKADGGLAHQGGIQLAAGSADRETVLAWLSRGALRSAPNEPKLSRLDVVPAQLDLRTGVSRQLLVTAVFSDGTKRDVTAHAVYTAGDRKLLEVSPAGKVTASGTGESFVGVNYSRASALARVTVPQTLASPFPPLAANNRIDELVWTKLKRLGIPPSDLCTDEEFLRRAHLDVTGLLPSAAEARAWLEDRSPGRRARLIDTLLEREEYVDFHALKWSDLLRIKSEYPVRLWPKAVAVYYRWVWESIASNKPYDRFVRELLTSNGSNFRVGPANFLRANSSKDPQTMGETAALLFLGIRMGCARCHAHPTEGWTADDDLGFGAFFASVRFKSTHEWKEEIVYPDFAAAMKHPKTRAPVTPRFPDGTSASITNGQDPRVALAEWITAPGNPWFARNIVNRIWFWLLGTGIVHEPDDLRPSNPPENPELLDYLAQELVSHRYDLKHIYRLILNSRTYQLSAKPNRENAADRRHFSHYTVRRLTAEQILDAVSRVTGTSEKVTSKIPEPFSFWPATYRAAEIEDGNAECSFLDLFGRAPRDTPYESDRNSDATLRQALYLLNSEQLASKLSGSPHIRRLVQAQTPDAAVVDELYLSALSRFPAPAEKQTAVAHLVKNRAARAEAVQDLFWALMNTKEFLFAH